MIARGTLAILIALPLLADHARASDPEAAELQILAIRRVYVDRFGGGEGAEQLRDMVIANLQRTKLFVVTETLERADAVLRGSGEDLVFTDVFQTSEGITARTGISAGSGSSSSRSGRTSSAIQAGVGQNESTRIQERKHEASASVRLINRDGDVIWSTVQESRGGKFRSASADVAERIARQLLQDMEKARARRLEGGAAPKKPEASPSAEPAPGRP